MKTCTTIQSVKKSLVTVNDVQDPDFTEFL